MITAIVLCGGQGTRLRPVIGDLPKCLAPVAGRPFLEYILKHLISQEVSPILLCTGYRHEQVEKYVYYECPLDMHESARIHLVREDSPLGTGGALRNALPRIESDTVLVINGDTYCNFNLRELLESYNGFAITLACGNNEHSSGVRVVSKKGVIENIPEAVFVPMDGWLGQIVAFDSWSFHDIGTPEGYKGAENFLREISVLP